MRQRGKMEFGGLPTSLSLRASAHTGVAISRIEAQFLMDEFRETVQKNGLYDDRQPEIRWRFPHQCAHWFGMTRSDDAANSNLSVRFHWYALVLSTARKTGRLRQMIS